MVHDRKKEWVFLRKGFSLYETMFVAFHTFVKHRHIRFVCSTQQQDIHVDYHVHVSTTIRHTSLFVLNGKVLPQTPTEFSLSRDKIGDIQRMSVDWWNVQEESPSRANRKYRKCQKDTRANVQATAYVLPRMSHVLVSHHRLQKVCYVMLGYHQLMVCPTLYHYVVELAYVI